MLSEILGWIYTAAWSLSFYGQITLNYQRKSVQGLSLEFLYLNVMAFLCYAIYTIGLYAVPSVREEYARRSYGAEPAVYLNDVFFAVHALLLSSATLAQVFIFKPAPEQSPPRIFWQGIFTVLAIVVASFLASLANIVPALDFCYLLSYIKLVASFIKLIPQLLLNQRRRSTLGWSFVNIALDFTGGIFSIAQLFVDSFAADPSHPWQGIKGNGVKLGLGLVAICFNCAFIAQHLVFGPVDRSQTRGEEEEDPLLQ